MDIKTLLFGIFFLFLVVGLFYFITIFIQKVILKIREKRRTSSNNTDDYIDYSKSDTITHCGIKSSKAILEAKKNMRSK